MNPNHHTRTHDPPLTPPPLLPSFPLSPSFTNHHGLFVLLFFSSTVSPSLPFNYSPSFAPFTPNNDASSPSLPLPWFPPSFPLSSASVTRILSLSNFPSELKTRDLIAAFSEWDGSATGGGEAGGGFKVKWVDDVSALIVFQDAGVGELRERFSSCLYYFF